LPELYLRAMLLLVYYTSMSALFIEGVKILVCLLR
jgi:hypothetical protein